MSELQRRVSEMNQWSVVTRICSNIDQAMEVAQEFLPRTQYVSLWPIKAKHWLVIARLPILVN